MLVYLIYKKPENSEPSLYAFTDKKYLKESFCEEREMSLFSVVDREVSKEEYKHLSRSLHSYILGRRGFETNSSSSVLVSKKTHVYITATETEEMDVFIKSDVVMYEMAKHTDLIVKYFKDDIIKALNTIHYFEIYKFANPDDMDYFIEGVSPYTIDAGNSNFKADMLSVFLYLYGNTMKKGK